jgi:hypothetical protein
VCSLGSPNSGVQMSKAKGAAFRRVAAPPSELWVLVPNVGTVCPFRTETRALEAKQASDGGPYRYALTATDAPQPKPKKRSRNGK